jgi:hypothetical protein
MQLHSSNYNDHLDNNYDDHYDNHYYEHHDNHYDHYDDHYYCLKSSGGLWRLGDT